MKEGNWEENKRVEHDEHATAVKWRADPLEKHCQKEEGNAETPSMGAMAYRTDLDL